MSFRKHSDQFAASILLSCTPILKDKTLHGFVLVARDISETDKLIHNLEEKTQDLEKTMSDLKTMNDLMVGRELKIIQLKKEVTQLEQNFAKS